MQSNLRCKKWTKNWCSYSNFCVRVTLVRCFVASVVHDCSDVNPCHNGGTCKEMNRSPQSAGEPAPRFRCVCRPGYQGALCELGQWSLQLKTYRSICQPRRFCILLELVNGDETGRYYRRTLYWLYRIVQWNYHKISRLNTEDFWSIFMEKVVLLLRAAITVVKTMFLEFTIYRLFYC